MTSWATGRPAAAAAATATAASETGPAAPQTAGARRHFQLPPLPHNPVLDNPVCSSSLPCHPPPSTPALDRFSVPMTFSIFCVIARPCPHHRWSIPVISRVQIILRCQARYLWGTAKTEHVKDHWTLSGSWILVLPKGSCSSRPDLITCNLFVLVLFQEWHPPLVFVALRF